MNGGISGFLDLLHSYSTPRYLKTDGKHTAENQCFIDTKGRIKYKIVTKNCSGGQVKYRRI